MINSDKQIDESGLKEELAKLGISTYFLEQKHVRNLYMAKRIVEGYDFEKDLSKEEKSSLIHAILNNASLDEESTSGCYLSTLMKNLQQIGLKEQEIYGTIINLGVNGTVLEESGYGYDSLLKNQNNSCQTIIQHKERIERRVGPITILTALSKNLDEQEKQGIQEELEKLGISSYFIQQRDVRNLYVAKRIVEGYDFGRKLRKKEKRAIIHAIVANSRLDIKRHRYISTIMHRFQQIGLNEQDIYGAIINLGVNRAVVEEKGCGYADLLMNSNNACQTIANHIGEIQTEVTEGTIQKALNKAEKTMKKAVKHQKEKGTISSQTATRVQLMNLVRGEQAHEMRAAANPR